MVVVFNEGVEIVVSGCHHLGAEYVVSVGDKACLGGWGIGVDFLVGGGEVERWRGEGRGKGEGGGRGRSKRSVVIMR